MAGIASASILEWTRYRDRRSMPRKAVLDLSLITVHMGNGGFGVMLDASEDGLGVQVMGGAPPGTELKLAFEVPDAPQPVEGVGLVNWYDGRGRIGIKFRELKPLSQNAFRLWVNSLPEPNTPDMPGGSAGEHTSLTEQAQSIKSQIASHQLDFDLVLQHLTERTVEMTGASGGAVAIQSGENMVCRASAGLAPEVGVSIDPSSALTSQCIRTAGPVRCDDTETDPRVNRETCRQLDLRSSLIVPIVLQREVKGVLELFSQKPNTFSNEHLLLLDQLARFIGEVMNQPTPPFVPQVQDSPVATELAVTSSRSEPTVDSAIAMATASPTIAQPPAQIPAGAIPLVKPPIPEEKPAARTAEIEKILEEYKEEPSRDPRIIPLVALLILAIVIGIVWMYSRIQGSAAAPQPATVQAAPAKLVETTASATPQQEIPLPIDSLPIRQVETPTVSPPPKGAPVQHSELPEDTVRPVAQARQVPAGTRRETMAETPLEALSATGIGGAAQLSSVTFPTIVTTPNLRAQGVSGGMLLHRVEPEYPTMARKMRIAGDVELSARVTKSGAVDNVKKVRGSTVLAAAAIDAVKKWRYEPYVVNGETQEVDVNITLHFRLPN